MQVNVMLNSECSRDHDTTEFLMSWRYFKSHQKLKAPYRVSCLSSVIGRDPFAAGERSRGKASSCAA